MDQVQTNDSLFTSMSHFDANNLGKRCYIKPEEIDHPWCLVVRSYRQEAVVPESVGTVLGASRQCCGKKSQPVDTGMDWTFSFSFNRELKLKT